MIEQLSHEGHQVNRNLEADLSQIGPGYEPNG
jgi:hypothetical protein